MAAFSRVFTSSSGRGCFVAGTPFSSHAFPHSSAAPVARSKRREPAPLSVVKAARRGGVRTGADKPLRSRRAGGPTTLKPLASVTSRRSSTQGPAEEERIAAIPLCREREISLRRT